MGGDSATRDSEVLQNDGRACLQRSERFRGQFHVNCEGLVLLKVCDSDVAWLRVSGRVRSFAET
jgi:hypothetical protein